MKTNRAKHIKDLFYEALDIDPEERFSYLESKCDGDRELLGEIKALLEFDSAPEPVINVSPEFAIEAFQHTRESHSQTSEAWPEQIEGYRVLGVLGRGGMGVVYEAEQDRPKRKVALKLLARHAVSDQALRRFQQEAEILGRLKHPGIAQIFECGSIGPEDEGQAYLAMELIEGNSLSQHVAQNNPSIEQRLELFARICDAVHHAHQKGVIHRDLKPDNILVTHEGRPKILDFGIARVTETDLQVTTMHTQVGQLVGTITYMSPEQVSGNRDELDLRSDIYALGVILFELLSGKLPHDLIGRSIPDAIRVILEVDPHRLSSIDSMFRGDVDVIVTKALERDASRRYASAAEIAADIRRHLAHEPITARPASTFYQLRKFGKRNKPLVGGAIATVIALIMGLVFSVHFALRESQQREIADAASESALASEKESRQVAYRSRISAALASIDAENPSRARMILDDTDPRFRGWEWNYANTRLDRRLAFFPSETQTDVVTREDGTLVALVVQDGYPKVIEIMAGITLCTIEYSSPLDHLQFSGDGLRVLALSRNDNTLRSWDADTAAPISSHSMGPSKVTSMMVSWNGELASVVTRDKSFILNLNDGTIGQQFASWETEASLNPADRWYVRYGGWTLELFQREPNEEITFVAKRALKNASSMAWDVDRERIAFGLRGGHVEILELPSLNTSQTLVGITDDVQHIAFAKDHDMLAATGLDSTVQLWDIESGESVRKFHAPEAHRIAVDHDMIHLALGHADGAGLYAWEPPVSTELKGHDSYVYYTTFSPNGTKIASSGWDRTIRIWDARSGEQLVSMPTWMDAPLGLGFSADGTQLVTPLTVRDVATRVMKETLAYAVKRDPKRELTINRPGLFHWPENSEASEELKDRLDFWHLSRGGTKASREYAGGQTESSSLDKLLLALTTNRHCAWVVVVVRESGRELHQFGPFEPQISATTFSRDGTRLVIGDAGGVIRVMDLSDGAEIAQFGGVGKAVYSLEFSPDGSRLVSGCEDGIVRLWDTSTWSLTGELVGHTNYVHSVAFSPDGTQLVTGSGDNTIRIWDAAPAAVRYQEVRSAVRSNSD